MLISRRGLAAIVLPALLVGLGTGCTGNRTSTRLSGESEARPVRPKELARAEEEVKKGAAAAAQARTERWLAAHPEHPYRPEARYLLAQAQFAQGHYAEAEKNHGRVLKSTRDRTLKALAHLGRADANFELKKYRVASRQYHWLEQMYRDISAVPQDELFFKLGLCAKFSGFPETADYWFNRVLELYSTGPYAEEARRLHSRFGPAKNGKPAFYSLEVASFASEKKALAEAEAYRAKNYRNVHVIKYSALGNTYYGVRIGKYENENSVLRAKEDAELAGLSASIRPSLIHIPK